MASKISLFAAALLGASSLALLAADPASPFGLTPERPSTLLPEGQGGLPLIPDGIPALETAKKEKKSATAEAEDALRDRIRLRAAKTKAQSDPELQALWDRALKAPTDFEQRELFTQYYTRLCERLGQLDKSLTTEQLEVLRTRYVAQHTQMRMAPTEPPVKR